ncbi:MAG: response regulator [Betaproteobacteria bacterium]
MRILTVDDDRDTLVTLTFLLREEGFDVRSAHSVQQAWATLNDFDPDVVLLDIGLPDGNGYDLAREMRAKFGEKRPVLIAITASDQGADRILAQLAGFARHMGKPYDPLALIGVLKTLEPTS